MNDKEYLRIQEVEIKELLKIFGCVWIRGPRFSGKTFISEKISNSKFYVQEHGQENLQLLNLPIEQNPIFSGQSPRLIDEWQIIPQIWDKVRFIVDQNKGKKGLFILTGSSKPEYKQMIHNGAGRIATIQMQTLTFSEIIKSDAKISLLNLFEQKEFIPSYSDLQIDWVAKQLLYGGWPSLKQDDDQHFKFISEYIKTISNWNNKTIFADFLKSLARLNGTYLKKTTIAKDLKQEISVQTIQNYLDYMYNEYLIFNLNLWPSVSDNKRSKVFLKETAKVYFCDPSLGLHLLKFKNIGDLWRDLKTLGIYFENQVIKDLMVYAQALNGQLYFYRDSNNFEIDAIMELANGDWAAFEIKTSGDQATLDAAAKQLINFKDKIQKLSTLKEPKFLMIINAQPYAFQREDGVFVVGHTNLTI